MENFGRYKMINKEDNTFNVKRKNLNDMSRAAQTTAERRRETDDS